MRLAKLREFFEKQRDLGVGQTLEGTVCKRELASLERSRLLHGVELDGGDIGNWHSTINCVGHICCGCQNPSHRDTGWIGLLQRNAVLVQNVV